MGCIVNDVLTGYEAKMNRDYGVVTCESLRNLFLQARKRIKKNLFCELADIEPSDVKDQSSTFCSNVW